MLQNYGIEDIWREKKMELKKKEFLVWVSTDGWTGTEGTLETLRYFFPMFCISICKEGFSTLQSSVRGSFVSVQ